ATLKLAPVFTAARIGTEPTVAWKTDVLKAGRDDLREIKADLSSDWAIDIDCVYDDGVQKAKSHVSLTPKMPQQARDRWDAAFERGVLRIATRRSSFRFDLLRPRPEGNKSSRSRSLYSGMWM